MAKPQDQPCYSFYYAKALSQAALWHQFQIRKQGHPYISHLLRVSAEIWKNGGTEDEAVAGVLHDCVEDCGIDYETLCREFNPNIARIVMGVSEDKNLLKNERKADYVEKIKNGDRSIVLVSVVDKIDNAIDYLNQVHLITQAVVDFYKDLLPVYQALLGDIPEFQNLLQQIEQLVPQLAQKSSTPKGDLSDYLEIDSDFYEGVRLIPEIEEVERNPYYIGLPMDGLRHYRLNINVEYPPDWTDGYSIVDIKTIVKPLCCYTSYAGEMDLDKFSQDIRSECQAVVSVLLPSNLELAQRSANRGALYFIKQDFSDIRPVQVFNYGKALNLNIENSERFLELYDSLASRLYNSHKWMWYLQGEYKDFQRWPFAIGDRLWDFVYPELPKRG